MIKVSGFTFVHNALNGGYPIKECIESIRPACDEIVVVDCASTDGTRQLLETLDVRIINGSWGNSAGATLKVAHLLHDRCEHEIILHAEADEVYSEKLIKNIRNYIEEGHNELTVHRLQVERNFQRIREYPISVHRVFRNGSTIKDGRTTTTHSGAFNIPPESGYLFDCTNVFRDTWVDRIKQNAALWSEEPIYRHTPGHFIAGKVEVDYVEGFLASPEWLWKTTPIDLPEILKPLVGVTNLKEYYANS